MIKLSKRLSHLADMVSAHLVFADVGTDHGYVPIYLVQTKKTGRAYALDVKEGPLRRAEGHIKALGLADYITVRLSDGLGALKPGEADSIMIAGMGGNVMLRILKEGAKTADAAKELILQPQSEIARVREYLYKMGYVIDKEDMVWEEGKYYPMMRVAVGKKRETASRSDEEWELIYRYGEILLAEKNAVLRQYLQEKIRQLENILEGLCEQPQKESIRLRKEQIARELDCARRAFAYGKEEQGCGFN